MSNQILHASETLGSSVSELFRDPLRSVTRERQRHLLLLSSVVLLLTLSVATVQESSIIPVEGFKISLAQPRLLATLTITLLLYLLTVFVLDAFQDLYASWLVTQLPANHLAKEPREFEASLSAWALLVRGKQQQLRNALEEATRTGKQAPFAEEIDTLDAESKSISQAIDESPNDPELWERWINCGERRVEICRMREAESDKASAQFTTILKELDNVSAEAPDSTRARIARNALNVYPRVRFLSVLIEVCVPILLSLGAIASVVFRVS